jgi:hypothetical protein
VKASVTIPVAVKLSPFFTALAHTAREFDLAGADGLVLFNRFYQPDIDPGAAHGVSASFTCRSLPSCRCASTGRRFCPAASRRRWP